MGFSGKLETHYAFFSPVAAVLLIGDVPKESRNFGAESPDLRVPFSPFFGHVLLSISRLCTLKGCTLIREVQFGLLVTFCFLTILGGANLMSNPSGSYAAGFFLRHITEHFGTRINGSSCWAGWLHALPSKTQPVLPLSLLSHWFRTELNQQ